MPSLDEVNVGDEIPGERQTIEQAQLIQYAGASGDFNPLHWDADFAAQVSPTGGVIAHGMLNMGIAGRVVTRWAGGPERVREISCSFRAPCPVGAEVNAGGEVVEVDAEQRTARLAIWVELDDGSPVVDRSRSHAVVQLD